MTLLEKNQVSLRNVMFGNPQGLLQAASFLALTCIPRGFFFVGTMAYFARTFSQYPGSKMMRDSSSVGFTHSAVITGAPIGPYQWPSALSPTLILWLGSTRKCDSAWINPKAISLSLWRTKCLSDAVFLPIFFGVLCSFTGRSASLFSFT
jgi:hypothetical protein